jgi:hypothetical protein
MYADNKIGVAMQAGKFPVTTNPINSYPSAYTTNGSVTSPTLAYDPPHPSSTPAVFTFGFATPKQTYFNVKTFNMSLAGAYMVTGIDVKIDYSFTNSPAGTGAAYRLAAIVGSKETEIQAYTTTQRTTHSLRSIANVREPNDGVWNMTDISNLVISMQGKNMTSTGTGTMNVYDAYVQFPNSRVVVGVRGENMFDVYSFQFRLNYTTSLLTYTRYSEGLFRNVALSEGGSTFPTVKSFTSPAPTLNGQVYASDVMQDPANRGIDDNATLLWVEFSIVGYGYTKLLLTDTGMSDSFNNAITHTATSGWFDNRLVGDADSDRDVDYSDFVLLAGGYGSILGQPAYREQADFDHDGDIDYTDFVGLAGNYGKTLPP